MHLVRLPLSHGGAQRRGGVVTAARDDDGGAVMQRAAHAHHAAEHVEQRHLQADLVVLEDGARG